jgi:MFS family permease
MFTDFQIDFGFVVAALVSMIMVLITGEEPSQLNTAWRVGLGLGAIPPLSLLWLRYKLKEPEEFNRETMKNTRTPWSLVLKFYGPRLLVVSLIWFIYDFSAYSFTLYSSTWIDNIIGSEAPLWKTYGFSVVVNLFYLPGSFAGAFISDWMGPKMCLAVFVLIQGLVGFLMV